QKTPDSVPWNRHAHRPTLDDQLLIYIHRRRRTAFMYKKTHRHPSYERNWPSRDTARLETPAPCDAESWLNQRTSIDHPPDFLEQRTLFNRLRDVARRTDIERELPMLFTCTRRHHQNRYGLRLLAAPQCLNYFISVHLWHLQIRNDHIVRLHRRFADALFAVTSRHHLVTCRLQHSPDKFT